MIHPRGLALIEVVFAMGLLALGFLFVLGIVPTGLTSVKRSEDIEAATAYGNELIEDARRTLPPLGPQELKLTFNATEFKIVREIYAVDNDLTDVVVVAQWTTDKPGVRLATRLHAQPPSPAPSP